MRGHWKKPPQTALYRMSRAFLVSMLIWIALPQLIHSQTKPPQEKAMHHYVLIFRPTRALTAEELKQRAVEIPAWVKRVGEMGITIDPKALSPSAMRLSQKNGGIVTEEGSADPTLTNLVFFDAGTREQAMEVARIHPGLHYGVTVEVREWTSPAANPTAQK
jgi:hypothetical protein